MFSSKNLFKSIFLIFLLSFFTGCIHKIDKHGLTLSLSEYQLTQSFKDSFPMKESFGVATFVIGTPQISIPKNSTRVNTTINFSISTILTPKEVGAIKLSGVPTFNKKESAIYLEDVKLIRAVFAKLDTHENKAKALLLALQPMVNEAFKKFPIYKIKKDSFQGSFVKDVKVGDEALLVTFGI